jgi:hypothetical protein
MDWEKEKDADLDVQMNTIVAAELGHRRRYIT